MGNDIQSCNQASLTYVAAPKKADVDTLFREANTWLSPEIRYSSSWVKI